MGDPTPPSLSFPPGCRFFPSDHQLLYYYLASKNNADRRFGVDAIKEIDFYNYSPFDLPEITCFRFGRGGRKRHWYCYTARVLKERKNRKGGGGYWKRRGRVTDVMGDGAGKVIVGTRKTFVFYLGDSPKQAIKTDWIMYEYALIHPQQGSFVVCRVFVGSSQQRNHNNISEQISGSCGEISVTTVRHIGIQHDGTSTRVDTEAKSPDGNPVDPENNVGPVTDVNNQLTSSPAGEQIRSPPMVQEALTAQQLITILEEDYIELDDLLSPLTGID